MSQLPKELKEKLNEKFRLLDLKAVRKCHDTADCFWFREIIDESAETLWSLLLEGGSKISDEEMIDELKGLISEGDISHWSQENLARHFTKWAWNRAQAEVVAGKFHIDDLNAELTGAYERIAELERENAEIRKIGLSHEGTIENLKAKLQEKDAETESCGSTPSRARFKTRATILVGDSTLKEELQGLNILSENINKLNKLDPKITIKCIEQMDEIARAALGKGRSE